MPTMPLSQTVLDRVARLGLELDDGQRAVLDRLAGAVGPDGRGVYLWGPPGRGKTWLASAVMDAAQAAGFRVRRVHFHAFFRDLHARLFAARTGGPPGGSGAVFAAALDGLLSDVQLLCFDEFHAQDPGDAMLITRTLEQLQLRNVTLVATSNYPPEELLPDPLFHHLMEPAIRSLRSMLDVVALDGGTDYRRGGTSGGPRVGFAAGWHLPGPEPELLAAAGLRLPEPGEERVLRPGSHPLTARRAGDGQLWFEFPQLCLQPSSTGDFLRLCRDFSHWVLAAVPSAGTEQPEGWARFGNLVDVLYDAGIRLDILGLEGLGEQAPGSGHPVDLARVRSRLGSLQVPGRNRTEAAVRP